MKPFWLGCTGFAGLAILTSTIIHVQSAGVTDESAKQPSPNDGLRSTRGSRRAAARDGTADLMFEKIPAGEKREIALRRLAGRRAADDPAAAEHWAETIKLESEREMALNHIAVASGKTNPLMAIELAERHHLSPGIVETITEQWGRTEPEAAMRWAFGLPNKAAQENALLQIFTAYAEVNPAAAALLVTERLPPGSGQDEAAMTVLYNWLRFDEGAAVAWMENFPEGGLRVRAEAEVRGFRSYRAAASASRQEETKLE
jgi:hypothetical protein